MHLNLPLQKNNIEENNNLKLEDFDEIPPRTLHNDQENNVSSVSEKLMKLKQLK